MPTPEGHAARRARLATAAAVDAARRWARVDPDNIARSWTAQIPATVAVLSAAQFAAADQAEEYLDEFADPADQVVDPRGYAGVASDGGNLASLLYQPAIGALMTIGSGGSAARGLASGRASLDMIVRTQVADAGRAADQAALTARTTVQGYVRQIVGATCARCTILAGRFYRWNAGFQRHPCCDCIHVPATREQWRQSGRLHDSQQVYDSLTVAERQYAGWSLADQKAIAEGADLTFVTNMKGVTTAGTRRSAGRMTTDQIYKRAGGDRDEAIRLLRQNGYLTGAPSVRVAVPSIPTPSVASVRVAGVDRLDEISRDSVAIYGRSDEFRWDERLGRIAQRQGFDALPRVGTAEELDQAIAAGWIENWRGVHSDQAEMINGRLRHGPFEPGKGVYGNGVYVSPRLNTAEQYADHSLGSVFQEFDSILRVAIDPKARIIDYDDLRNEYREWLRTQPNKGKLTSDQLMTWPKDAQIGALKLFDDIGRFAAARGYDVIKISPPHDDGAEYRRGERRREHYNVLNRSVLLIQEPIQP